MAIDPEILRIWITGWTLARQTPPPVADHGGFRVDVGWPEQRIRYVFPAVTAGLRKLSNTISEPGVLLKACAAPEEMRSALPWPWLVQPPGFLMTRDAPAADVPLLPAGYRLDVDEGPSVPVVRVFAPSGELAAIGRVVTIHDWAIYDRIETRENHRRRGLARRVMAALDDIARSRHAGRGILVATAAGRGLYEKIGWNLLSPYVTAAIPANHGAGSRTAFNGPESPSAHRP